MYRIDTGDDGSDPTGCLGVILERSIQKRANGGAPEGGGGPHSQPGARRRDTGHPGASAGPIPA